MFCLFVVVGCFGRDVRRRNGRAIWLHLPSRVAFLGSSALGLVILEVRGVLDCSIRAAGGLLIVVREKKKMRKTNGGARYCGFDDATMDHSLVLTGCNCLVLGCIQRKKGTLHFSFRFDLLGDVWRVLPVCKILIDLRVLKTFSVA